MADLLWFLVGGLGVAVGMALAAVFGPLDETAADVVIAAILVGLLVYQLRRWVNRES